jgi:4-hydroxy-tetrahydrodipicolinate synthase
MFKGSLVALITPMREDGSVDEKAYADFVDWQIKEGTNGVVPVGTTGESPTLSHDEHRRVVEIAIEVSHGRVPVIAGAGSNSTEEAIALARHAKEAGADAALIVTPYYNKPTQEGMFLHYTAIADAVDLPIIIYNIPPRSVVDMSVETMARLAKHRNIIGVKDATANLVRPLHTRRACGDDFCQLSGEDHTALSFNAAGGVGCISVSANGIAEPAGAAARRAVRRNQPRPGEIRGIPAGQNLGTLPPAARPDHGTDAGPGEGCDDRSWIAELRLPAIDMPRIGYTPSSCPDRRRPIVMAGRVPAIRARTAGLPAPGTSPAMTHTESALPRLPLIMAPVPTVMGVGPHG